MFMALKLSRTSGSDLYDICEEGERIKIQGNGGDDVFTSKDTTTKSMNLASLLEVAAMR